jgi:UDP-N-acetylmuramoylalanine--D-glutamate ligase
MMQLEKSINISSDIKMNRRGLKNARVAVLGAARSGIAVSRLLLSAGARVLLSDHKPYDQLTPEAKTLGASNFELEHGGHTRKILDTDLICISPGLSLDISILQEAQKSNIPIVGEIELASWFCEAPMFAITGSNGKTTTTTLTGSILKKYDPATIIAGNIGIPFSEQVLKTSSQTRVVLEISSFQLETIYSFHPKIGVILNLTANHLDRYPDFDAYARAKLNILKNMTQNDIIIYNGDDEYLTKQLASANPKKLVFSLEEHDQEGAFWCHDKIKVKLNTERFTIYLKQLHLRGPHNRYNMMVAALIACLVGINANIISRQICSFNGIEHRLELVRNINDILFINDSKATTIESLIYGLRSFDKNIILIAGGKDKGADFSQANQWLQSRVKLAVLIGQAADTMATVWNQIIPIVKSNGLKQAVELAYTQAKAGDIILLSPACSSFDMFQDYEDRGNQFKQIVKGLG